LQLDFLDNIRQGVLLRKTKRAEQSSPASMGDKHAANQPSNFDLLKSTLEKMNKVVGSEEEDDEKEGDVDDDDEWS